MNIKLFVEKAWGGTKAHFVEFVVVATGLIMLFGLALIASAVIEMSRNVKTIHDKAALAEKEASEAKSVQKTLLENSELNRKQWELLEQHNPDIAVPQVIGEDAEESPTPVPRETPHVVVTKPRSTATPGPSPTARIEYRTRVKVKRVRAPTPKPFWDFFKKDPKRTR